ncbi:MAG: decaprenyl-phosphate phosphoribosyltransferase [Candidatus Zixiibacteriota bacterium]|nr:MAG: decaprenyl-phosphate phosphoribosyltransferase [candidate division Zixibacteria bacterium]
MIKGIITSMRPSHWVKNLVVFAALIFAQVYTDPDKIILALTAFIAFCLGTSAMYIINDVFDRENDKKHPVKSKRPITAGKISIPAAVAVAVILLILSIVLALYSNLLTVLALGTYMILNLVYSVFLKHVVIIDVMSIAAGFVLRAVAGGFAIEVPVSPWLLVCTILLALFLGFGKRRHELALLNAEAINHRKALANYSTPFLDQMISVVTASTVVAYAFYTLSPEAVENFGTHWLSATIPFVLYGIFRYLFLIFHKEMGGNPTKLMLTDVPLLLCVLLWLITVLIVINLG